MENHRERFGNVFLENSKKRQKAYPGTYFAPNIKELKALKPGDSIRIYLYTTSDGQTLKPWLNVVEARKDSIQCITAKGFQQLGIPTISGTICDIPFKYICEYRN
jgi:hypothetical protein